MTIDPSVLATVLLTAIMAYIGWSMRDNIAQFRKALAANQQALSDNTHAVLELRGDFKASLEHDKHVAGELDDLCDRLGDVERHLGLKPPSRRPKT